MTYVLLLISLVFMLPGIKRREGREKKLYIALLCVVAATGLIAGGFAASDHIGASLSGMISIFMR